MRKNKVIMLFLTVLLVFSLASCKHIIVTTIGTLKDLIVDIEEFELKVNELSKDKEDEQEVESSSLDYEYTVDGLIYKREEIINHLGTYQEQTNERFYLDELEHLSGFLSSVKEVITDNQDKKTGEDLLSHDITYNINVTIDGSVLIHYTYKTYNEIYKLRVVGSKLHIEAIQYHYDEHTYDPLSEEGLEFEYYNFFEDDSIVKISITEEQEFLTFASLHDGTYYVVEHEENLVEDIIQSLYTVDYYNSDNQSLNQYRIIDGEIISESINVYDLHSVAYQYIDYDVEDEVAYLRVNFLQAEGYDHIITTAYNGPTNKNEGIYDIEGNSLYNGDIMFNYNDQKDTTRAFITIITDPNEIIDELFTLSGFGLNLQSGFANPDSFTDNKVDDVVELSKELKIGQLDFFKDNIDIEAYQYIDVDIKAIINKFYNPTIPVQVNDDLLFSSDMIAFYENFNINKQVVVTEDSSIDDITMTSNTYLDINNRYYHTTSTDVVDTSKSYLLREINDKLYTFINDEGIRNKHSLASDTSTEESFMMQLGEKINISLALDNIYTVTKLSDLKYQITADDRFLGLSSYRLIEDKSSYVNYIDSTVEAVITFSEDYTSYTVEFELRGLTNQDTGEEVLYTGKQIYSLESFELYSPWEDEDYTFSLVSNFEDVLHFSGVDEIHNIEYLENESRWMKLGLTVGSYTFIEAEYDEKLTYTVYDEEHNIISSQKEFIVDTEGIYYIEISSTVTQEVTIQFTESDFDLEASETLNFDNDVALFNSVPKDERFYIITPSDERRILKLTIDEANCNCTYEDMFTLLLVPNDLYDEPQLRFISSTVSSYYYLEPNMNYYIKASANTDKIHQFKYELITLPDSDTIQTDITVDTIYEHPDVYLTGLQNQVRVHFSVSVKPLDTLMSINTYFRAHNFTVKLYKENGEEVDFVSYLDLSPGNYYFEYKIDSDESIMILSVDFDDLN